MERETGTYRVGLTYNLKSGKAQKHEDDEAELDDRQTVDAIAQAIRSAGCEVVLMEATGQIVQMLDHQKIDIVFNFAEGLKGRGREAQVPALLNLMGIPFTGSDETTLGVALDKALAKRVVAYDGIRTPRFQVFFTGQEPINPKLGFPVIVKPNSEGSSKGIQEKAIAHTPEEVRKLVGYLVREYHQPALVEEFIHGREFTVGLIGNGENLQVLPVMEIHFQKGGEEGFYSYRVKKHADEFTRTTCPAKLDPKQKKAIEQFARKVFQVLECKDVARIDLRWNDKDGRPTFIEINPLPGLIDGYSDLTLIARAAGMPYPQLILSILNAALLRQGMAPVQNRGGE
ncbi:MAG TPA: ATP-grasp domain-containing protein [Thermotogota bacterium]|nr:ATP-grasp domain-containing protein [Thermotogota bacterium]HRW92320.1 ATP-grasp domain-containing protein [Thermotogota bacterium]